MTFWSGERKDSLWALGIRQLLADLKSPFSFPVWEKDSLMCWCETRELKGMQISSWIQLLNGSIQHLFNLFKGTKWSWGSQESLLRLSGRSCYGLAKVIRNHSLMQNFSTSVPRWHLETQARDYSDCLGLSVILTQTYHSLCYLSSVSMDDNQTMIHPGSFAIRLGM